MKIGCKCGGCIVDNSDGHSDKAWFIPDKNWDGFWGEINNAITSSGKSKSEKEYAVNSIGRTSFPSAYRTIYQCNVCGRVYISNEGGSLEMFEPESENTCKTVLNSSVIYSYPEKIRKINPTKKCWWEFWRRA